MSKNFILVTLKKGFLQLGVEECWPIKTVKVKWKNVANIGNWILIYSRITIEQWPLQSLDAIDCTLEK
jgi:hypothetical protein